MCVVACLLYLFIYYFSVHLVKGLKKPIIYAILLVSNVANIALYF